MFLMNEPMSDFLTDTGVGVLDGGVLDMLNSIGQPAGFLILGWWSKKLNHKPAIIQGLLRIYHGETK